MSDDDRGLASEGADERDQIAAERVGIVGLFLGNVGRSVAAGEKADGAKARGCERWSGCVPRVRRVGKAVDQQHERPLARLEVAETKAVGFDEPYAVTHGAAS